MSESKFLKCTCAQCGGHIEFPAEGIGQTINCPHCQWPTELTLNAPEETSAGSSRSLKWFIAGVMILVIGVAGSFTAVVLAKKLIPKQRAGRGANLPSRVMRTNAAPAAVPPQAQPSTVINEFAVTGVKIVKTPGSSLVYASGTLKNESTRQRFGVTVELDLFDEANQKIGTTKDYNRDTIEPAATWTFRALLVQKGVASARVTAIREQQ